MKVKTRTKTKTKLTAKKRERTMSFRKRVCRFCADKARTIDYKDVRLLEMFFNERGKILSTRYTGNCAKHQRRIAEAIRKARFISLVPYARV